jgi:hypothetical protein
MEERPMPFIPPMLATRLEDPRRLADQVVDRDGAAVRSPIPPRMVQEGPCCEVVLTGDQAGASDWLAGERVVLPETYPGGGRNRYTLKERERADGHELWGVVEANFDPAAVRLKRVR